MLPCKVELSCFMGSYQNYHVRVGDTLVKITDNCPVNKKIFSVGDSAFISFDPACAHLPVAVLFGLGFLAVGGGEDELEELLRGFLHGHALQKLTGVEVDPAVLLGGQVGVGGHLQRGRGAAQGGAAAGGEHDQLRAGSGQGGDGANIVAGAPDQVQALAGDGLGVLQHVLHFAQAALLGAAQGFFFQGGDAARLVAGRRILVDGHVVVLIILLEAVDQVAGLFEHFLVPAPAHDQGFRAEHFGHFGEQRRAARRADAVADRAQEGVGGDAGEAVGATALEAHHKLGNGLFGAHVVFQLVLQLLDELERFGLLILPFLAHQELDPLFRPRGPDAP